MVKIRNSNPKQSGGGYERLIGVADMASIFTKAQSTVISKILRCDDEVFKASPSHPVLLEC